ncbi:MAG: response regulator [Pseudomonadota bacterium]
MARILLMEDDIETAFQISGVLERNGHDTVWRRNGTEALDFLTEETCDLLITDIYVQQDGHIASDGGHKLIGLYRTRHKPPRGQEAMPILAISGAVNYIGNPNALNLAKSLGANAVLPKPIREKELVDMVEALLDGKTPISVSAKN